MIDVFVYCTSHPIIEKSSLVRFAPFPRSLVSSTVHKELDTSGLGILPNTFDKVDDFNWLKRQASPNWSINSGGVAQADELDTQSNPWMLVNDKSRPLEQALGRILPRNDL
ncbi:hypothetical protein H4R99_006018 [Coemansia sp. RSA 1722]|nr:hypothetical protein H4R99_006018 [Coemansia sp. RSA 1722]